MHWNRPATGSGSEAAWFEGNIKTCADRGMRLPTFFETNVDGGECGTNTNYCHLPTGDGTPVWAGEHNGVPSPETEWEMSWTATAHTYLAEADVYRVWDASSRMEWQEAYFVYEGHDPEEEEGITVRCVLPSH
jgi:hypothetical protein